MSKRLLLWFVVALLLGGCTAKAPPALPGLVHTDFPVYAPATMISHMGGFTGADVGVLTHETMTWKFKTDDAASKVVDFYNSRLSGAEKSSEDGDTLFTYKTFPGVEDGEFFQVSIQEHEFYITECLKKGKRKD